MKSKYPVFVQPDYCTDGSFCWVAVHPDLPGCAAHAEGPTEAKILLDQAREAYLRHLQREGITPPEPGTVQPLEWMVGKPYSEPVAA